MLGSFPLIKSNPSTDHLFTNLPVMIVSEFWKVTPAILAQTYHRFINTATWEYERLTVEYWEDVVFGRRVELLNDGVGGGRERNLTGTWGRFGSLLPGLREKEGYHS